jgi:hypothetical protein
MRLSVSHAESVKNLFILSKDSILIRLRVFHFVPTYTCSVLNCLSQFETLHYPWIPSCINQFHPETVFANPICAIIILSL